MATKKATPKKSTSTTTRKSSSAAAKKTTVKTASKKTTAKSAPRKTTAKQKKADLKSFHVYQDPEPFFNVRFNRQTIYWLVIAALAISFSAWVLSVQADINNLFDQIEALQSQA